MDRRILVYATGRTGSYELCEWLVKELSFPLFIEGEEDYAYTGSKIVKKDFHSEEFQKIEHLYDRKIFLYRRDTLSQAESQFRAEVSGIYHQPKDGPLTSYRLQDQTLVDNAQRISHIKLSLDINNEFIFLLGNKGLLISYEEIFIDGTGENKILDYIGFEAKSKLYNPERKMRAEFIRSKQYIQKIDFEIIKERGKKTLI
jgi:LPS sulfotransferase NodH